MAVASDELRALVGDVPDFGPPGVVLEDVAPLLRHPASGGRPRVRGGA